jgi:HJR/Mrr/RecB family endonuclease
VLFYTTAQDMMVIPRQLRDLFTHFVLFQGLSLSRKELIFQQQKLPLSEETFIEIYNSETKQPHSYIILC